MKYKTAWMISLIFAQLLLLSACFRNDTRTLKVSVPQMKTSECVQLIQSALGRLDGVISVEISMADHSLTVTYDGRKLAIKNIEIVIADLGFDANAIPGSATAKAALPAACQ